MMFSILPPPPFSVFPCFLALVQIFNFKESVTLDFLDAELEDSNKEEVKTTRLKQTSFLLSCLFNMRSVYSFYQSVFLFMYLFSVSALSLDPPTDD